MVVDVVAVPIVVVPVVLVAAVVVVVVALVIVVSLVVILVVVSYSIQLDTTITGSTSSSSCFANCSSVGSSDTNIC